MNIEALLDPISESTPGGRDCAHTREFQELTTLSEFLSARAVLEDLDRQSKTAFAGDNAEADQKMALDFAQDARRKADALAASVKDVTGKTATVVGAAEAVIARGEEMLKTMGKDLRVAQMLALALFTRHGLEGLVQGTHLLDSLLERFPEHLHPTPDDDAPQDTIARALIVSDMISGKGFTSLLRKTVFLQSPLAGQWTGWDAEAADPSAVPGMAIASIVASLRTEGPAMVAGQNTLVATCIEGLERVTGRFPAGLVRGDRLVKLLRRVNAHLSSLEAGTAPENLATEDAAVPLSAPGSSDAHGRLQTREDACRLILNVCQFIERMEPSHPAPLFLRRAERLLRAKDFFAIVRDMAPDSITELERITGHKETDTVA